MAMACSGTPGRACANEAASSVKTAQPAALRRRANGRRGVSCGWAPVTAVLITSEGIAIAMGSSTGADRKEGPRGHAGLPSLARLINAQSGNRRPPYRLYRALDL